MSTNSSVKPKRSIAISIAGWILLLGALVNILFGLLFLYASGLLTSSPKSVIIFNDAEMDDLFDDVDADLVEGVADLFLGVVQLVITIGFWRVQRWAWVAAMSWQALKLLFEIATVLLGGGTFITILFAALLVFLLSQSDVRRAFNIRRENESSSVTPLHTLDIN